jgi:hypothetical protein
MEETYSAYCITPFLTSWLGRGTSRLSFPVTPTGGCAPCALYGEGTEEVGFRDVDEMAATARYGIMAELGLAVAGCSLAVVAMNGGAPGATIERTSKRQPSGCSRAGYHAVNCRDQNERKRRREMELRVVSCCGVEDVGQVLSPISDSPSGGGCSHVISNISSQF